MMCSSTTNLWGKRCVECRQAGKQAGRQAGREGGQSAATAAASAASAAAAAAAAAAHVRVDSMSSCESKVCCCVVPRLVAV